MKMIEIFYLMIIFNIFMFIFGTLSMPNGQPLNPGMAGSEEGFGSTDIKINGKNVMGLDDLLGAMLLILGLLAIAYGATMIPGVGTAKTPMAIVYSFAIGFQLVYAASWATFWGQIYQKAPAIGVFALLFTFLVESIFVIGFLQMTTGGWGLFK